MTDSLTQATLTDRATLAAGQVLAGQWRGLGSLLPFAAETRRLLARSPSIFVQILFGPQGMVQIGDTLAEGAAARGDAHVGAGQTRLRPSGLIGALDGTGALGAN
jgi:hypothetical protein